MSNDHFYFDVLVSKLLGTAKWRQRMAVKFPGDHRNAVAVKELERLAQSDFSEVATESWSALRPYLEKDSFAVSLNEATKDIGFRKKPADITAFVDIVTDTAQGFELPASIGGAA